MISLLERSLHDLCFGQRLTRVTHITGKSDSDEKVEMVFENGTIVRFGTSEWLNIEIVPIRQPEPEAPTI